MFKMSFFLILLTPFAVHANVPIDDCQIQLQQAFAPTVEPNKAEGSIVRREHDIYFNTTVRDQDHPNRNQSEVRFFKDPIYLNNGFVAKEQSYAEFLIDKRERDNYFNAYEQSRHKIHIKNGLLYNSENKLVDTNGSNRIYIMDENLDIYILQEEFLAPGRRGRRVHHSHLSRGKRTTAPGQIKVSKGLITYADNQSGHYSPELSFLAQFKQVLESHSANLSKAQFYAYLQGPITLSSNGNLGPQKLPNTISVDFSAKEITGIKRQNELNRIMEILVTPLGERTEIENEYMVEVERELQIEATQILINYGIKYFTE